MNSLSSVFDFMKKTNVIYQISKDDLQIVDLPP